MECGVKLSKHDDRERVNQTFLKSLVGSQRYLTCTRLNILFGVGLLSRNIEVPTMTHLITAKRILRHMKGTLDFGLLYLPSIKSLNLLAIAIVIGLGTPMIERVIMGLYSIWVICIRMDVQKTTNCDCMLLLPLVFVMQCGLDICWKSCKCCKKKIRRYLWTISLHWI